MPQFREYVELERKRTGGGLTPLEYQRWLDLDGRLGSKFGDGAGGAPHARSRPATRLVVEFRSPEHFCDAYIGELARGGVFVHTPFAPEIGTELVLRVQIRAPRQTVELPGVVSSNNVSNGFSTDYLGMGVHFSKLEPEQRLALDELFALAGSPMSV